MQPRVDFVSFLFVSFRLGFFGLFFPFSGCSWMAFVFVLEFGSRLQNYSQTSLSTAVDTKSTY